MTRPGAGRRRGRGERWAWKACATHCRRVRRAAPAVPTCAHGGYGKGCLAILGFEGSTAGRWKAPGGGRRELVRGHGGLPVGRSPGEAWRRQRFAAPYLRDELLTHGVMAETLETATSWSNVAAAAPRDVRRDRSERCAPREPEGVGDVPRLGTSTRRAPRCTSRCWRGSARGRGSSSGRRSSARRATRLSRHGGTITHHHVRRARPPPVDRARGWARGESEGPASAQAPA